MKTETRELYCYTTGTEPFKTRYENLSTEMVSLYIATRGLIKDAIGQYGKDYGDRGRFSDGFKIFSQDDFENCVRKIINDVKEREGIFVMDEYTREFLSRYSDYIVEPSEMVERRKHLNGIEANGALWMAAKWIEEHIPEETMRGAYDNITGMRTDTNGNVRFDTYESFELYDREKVLVIGGVVVCGECVYLEVWNVELDKVVAYIGLN